MYIIINLHIQIQTLLCSSPDWCELYVAMETVQANEKWLIRPNLSVLQFGIHPHASSNCKALRQAYTVSIVMCNSHQPEAETSCLFIYLFIYLNMQIYDYIRLPINLLGVIVNGL